TPLVFPTMSIMDHRLICQWLHLPPESWPPDPYRLFWIEPAALTHALLEERVQERIQIVRRYQLVHPDECTEAMNRLAQAYVSLGISHPDPEPVAPQAETPRTELGRQGTRVSSDPSIRAAIERPWSLLEGLLPAPVPPP